VLFDLPHSGAVIRQHIGSLSDLVQVIHANGGNPVHAQLLGGFDTGMAGQDHRAAL